MGYLRFPHKQSPRIWDVCKWFILDVITESRGKGRGRIKSGRKQSQYKDLRVGYCGEQLMITPTSSVVVRRKQYVSAFSTRGE